MVVLALWLLAGALFEDATASSGLIFRHQSSATTRKYLPETMGAGVAIFDADRDGWMDVFFVNGARITVPQADGGAFDKAEPKYWNRLFRNTGKGRFEDATERFGLRGSGYGMGAATGDFNNDGFADLLVANYESLLLYRNREGKSFEDVTAAAGLGGAKGWFTCAGWIDYDRDGDLDLFLCRYLEHRFSTDKQCGMNSPQGLSYCHPDEYAPVSSLLYRNDGGRFTDVSRESGVAAHKGKALGVAFADFDSDGLPDIAVANDSTAQFLFHNLGAGRFAEVAHESGMAYDDDGRDFAGMGIEAGDIDQDGRPDLIITTLSLQRYAFFRNLGKLTFDYATPASGLGAITHAYAGWGVRVFDARNDGGSDVFLANSHVMDNIAKSQPSIRYEQPPLLLRYERGRFSDRTAAGGPALRKAYAARGLASGDLDNDGCVDMVMTDNNGPATVFRNTCEGGNHWLAISLQGVKSPRDGQGARVTVRRPDGTTRYAEAYTAGSYLSAHDPRLFFGLGAATSAVVEIQWPSGAKQSVSVNQVDRVIELREEQPGP